MMRRWKAALEGLPSVFKYLLIAGVIAFIGFLFPDHVQFKYQFERGQTWRYYDLEAPFDFAIQKGSAEMESEIELLESNFSPYYQFLPQRKAEQLTAFEEDFRNQIDSAAIGELFPSVQENANEYLRLGRNFLEEVYGAGVIALAPEHQEAGEGFTINLIEGSTTQERLASSFLTLPDARQQVSDTLFNSSLAEPDFLYPLMEEHLQPNIVYNDTLTERFREDMLATVSPTRGMVRRGDLIVPRGGRINDEVYQKLISLRSQYEQTIMANESRLSVVVGYYLLVTLIIGVFVVFLARNVPEVFDSLPNLIFVFLWFVVYGYLVHFVNSVQELSTYLIPFCIVPIVVKSFFNARLALFTHIVLVLIAGFLANEGLSFIFLQVLAGIAVLLSNVDTRDWTQFFYSIFFVFLAYGLGYLGLSLIQEADLQHIDWGFYRWIFLNVFLTLLAYPLIPLLERLFGFTSSITLVELSDMNRPLLQELSLKAPGTLQHSIQVANLAEAAARRIGADALLVKVGAMYHDVGKTLNPTYFIENDSGQSPHDEKSFLESAEIIIGHVTEGEKMARKARLPRVVTNFIRTHHGTTRVEYFYRNYLKANPEKSIDENLFRYPGPRPETKEETILMLADSIEAACRSLKNPTGKDIDELVDKIISGKITHKQLDNSALTFEELQESKEVFKQMLRSIHHVRIEYPEEDQEKAGSTTAEVEEGTPKA